MQTQARIHNPYTSYQPANIQTRSRIVDPLPVVHSLPFGTAFSDAIKAVSSDCVPTPGGIVDFMIKKAELKPNMTVLEPSAGTGNIAEKLAMYPVNLSVIEMLPELQEALKQRNFRLVGNDFLKHDRKYDRILMNPPYSKGQAIKHTYHAFDCLKPGGKLVTILPDYLFHPKSKARKDFNRWLRHSADKKVTIEKLDGDIFHNDESQIKVPSRLMVVTKK